LFGGKPGAVSKYVLNPGTNREQKLPSKTAYIDLEPGTLVRVQSAGGGGYGDPQKRDPKLIADDLRNGYISSENALAQYGYTQKKTDKTSR
jgi:N-methylhydantoinase B